MGHFSMQRQGLSGLILHITNKFGRFLCTRANAFIYPSLYESKLADPYSNMETANDM